MTPLIGIPVASERPRCFGMAAVFLLVFVVCYGGADVLSGFVPWRIHVDLPFEKHIPFLAWAAPIYLTIDLLLLLAPFVLRTWRQLAPLFLTLVAETALAAVCFVLLPVESRFLPYETPQGWLGLAFGIADTLNLEHNFLPSLHVAYAVTAALAYGRETSRAAAVFFQGWALAIAASTLLLYQHHLLDVVTGCALGIVAWTMVGRRARQESSLEAFDVELLCLENQFRFARRHPRYLLIFLAITRASLPGWRRNRVLRTGFCALQAIDDLLDGDRPCAGEPLDLVDDLVRQIESRQFAGDDLARLTKAFVNDLNEVGGEPALADAVRLIQVMQFDRRRRRDGLLLDEARLREHHRQTFTLSVDLMLIAGRCELRAADVSELIEAFGWCSVVRDLRPDLEAGLINLPRGVVEAVRREMPEAKPVGWVDGSAVREWLEGERRRAVGLLDETESRLKALKGRRGASTLAMFARSIGRYANR